MLRSLGYIAGRSFSRNALQSVSTCSSSSCLLGPQNSFSHSIKSVYTYYQPRVNERLAPLKLSASFSSTPSSHATYTDRLKDIIPEPNLNGHLPWGPAIRTNVLSLKTGEVVEEIELDKYVFGAPIRPDVLHSVVVWQLAARRQGTHSAKTRGEVKGTTRKPWPQKGGGRARAGDLKAPHMRGGGVAFAPKPRNYYYALPQKIRRLGLRVALSAKYAEGRLVIVDDDDLESHKTKEFAKLLQEKGLVWQKENVHHNPFTNVMLVSSEPAPTNMLLASRLLSYANVVSAKKINVYDILKHKTLVISRSAMRSIVSYLSTDKVHQLPPVDKESALGALSGGMYFDGDDENFDVDDMDFMSESNEDEVADQDEESPKSSS